MLVCCLRILVPAGLALLCETSIAGGAELPRELTDCRALTSPEARLDCYDEFVDAYEASGSEALAVQTTAPSQTPTGQAAAPSQASTHQSAARALSESERIALQEDIFGKNKGEIRGVLEATGIEELDQIEATIARVQKNAGGKVVITLDNGQVWLQTDSRRARVSEDDRITIHRIKFGSYNLRKEGTVLRVKRIS